MCSSDLISSWAAAVNSYVPADAGISGFQLFLRTIPYNFWLLRFRKLDMTQPEQRQALVDTFINSIYLYDDKVLITFNYKEGTETVAFGEAVKVEKSSDMSARGAPIKER